MPILHWRIFWLIPYVKWKEVPKELLSPQIRHNFFLSREVRSMILLFYKIGVQWGYKSLSTFPKSLDFKPFQPKVRFLANYSILLQVYSYNSIRKCSCSARFTWSKLPRSGHWMETTNPFSGRIVCNLSECAISTIGSWIWTDPELIAISYMPEICRWLEGKFRGWTPPAPSPCWQSARPSSYPQPDRAVPVSSSRYKSDTYLRRHSDVPVDHAPRAAIPYQGAGIPSHNSTFPTSPLPPPLSTIWATRILSTEE